MCLVVDWLVPNQRQAYYRHSKEFKIKIGKCKVVITRTHNKKVKERHDTGF